MKRRMSLIALWLALAAAPAFGQGCAMCWTGANAAGKKAQTALNRGIGMMMVTTLGMMGGLAVLAVWFRNSGQELPHDESADRAPSSP